MKRFWIACLAVICLFLLCSCGNSTSGDDSAAAIASLEQEIVELQERISELEEENSNLRTGGGNSVSDNTSTDSNIETPPISLELNTMSAVGDVMDITITGAEWSDSVLPSDTSKSYTYYEDDLFKGGAVKTVGKNSGIADDVRPGLQLFHAHVVHVPLDFILEGFDHCGGFRLQGFPFFKGFNFGNDFDSRHLS